MKISACTVARGAIDLGYPLVESIRSLLPIVDEYVVGVGDTDDGTWEAVAAIDDPRVKAFRSVWDLSPRGGSVISEETNKALVRCSGDWIVYLQADEVLHERDLPTLRGELEHRGKEVEALSFRYHHFYGSFAFVQDDPARWYRRATRAVRNGIGAVSIGDGCAFGVASGGNVRKVRGARSEVFVYHYGWARPPELMLTKNKGFDRLYHDEEWLVRNRTYPERAADVFWERGHLRRFSGDHPAVMRERVAAADWTFESGIERQPPDWIRRPIAYSSWLLQAAAARARRRLG